MKVKIVREIDIPFKALESYIKRVFGLTVTLSKKFDFSTVAELLDSVQWTNVLPVFIPQGVDNRRAVDSLFISGFKKRPYEEVGVMEYEGSEASEKPRLYLIESSVKPNVDTMGQSPDNLVKTGKLWLPLKGYAVALGFYNQITHNYLDSETLTWFPDETLPGVKSACVHWDPYGDSVGFHWRNSSYASLDMGARLAISVPLILKP
jgi:hypothetical protein